MCEIIDNLKNITMVDENCDPVEFQAFAWNVDDGTTNDKDYSHMNFTVHVFGKTKQGKSVAAHVTGYTPTFCVKFDPEISTPYEYENLFHLLQKQLVEWSNFGSKWVQTADYSDHLKEIHDPIIFRKDCWGFNFGRDVPFFKFSFRSMKAYNKIISFFKQCQKNNMTDEEMEDFFDEYSSLTNEDGMPDRDQQRDLIERTSIETGVPTKALDFIVKLAKASLPLSFAKGKLFEVIDPILRFAHMRNLKMAGWMRIAQYAPMKIRSLTTCDVEIFTTYDNLQPIVSDDISPHLKEMAFDIEAYSYNDLFPDPLDPRNYCYQIGITLKRYADRKFDRLLLHCRTPAELRESNSGYVEAIPPIPTCFKSGKPIAQCDKKECKDENGEWKHDEYMVATKVENYETEKDLLMRFSEIIVEEDPDLIYAYNSDIFDWNYLMVRAEVVFSNELAKLTKFRRFSRMKEYACEAKEAKFASSAYGDNRYMRVEIPGRLNIDLMIWIQRNMPADRYPSYSLDTVAEKEIGEQKRDVDAKDIFQAFRSGDPKELTRIADYCCQDTVLVQKLVNKLDVVTQMFEMANITDTPPMYLLQKGQQIKCFSQLSKEAMEKGFLIPLAEEREDGKFKGAIVLDPIIGKYDTPVSVLDFASLYPSIQVAYKVCYTTIVLNKKLHDHIISLKRQSLPLEVNNVKFDVIEWSEDMYVYRDLATGKRYEFTDMEDAKKMGFTSRQILEDIAKGKDSEFWSMGTKKHEYCFAQNMDSIIPDLQVKLKKSRKAVKAMMAPIEHSKDPDDILKYRVLNGRQLAIKVSMNSLYGFTSAFMMNLQALSACVTARGRQMIETTKQFLENDFEKIARNRLWTKEDYLTFFAKDGKQIVAEETGDHWIFSFRGQEICRTKIGEIPPGWIKKFPIAIEGKPWTDHDLSLQIVAGDSVTEDTPVLCRDSIGRMVYRTFDQLASGTWETRVDGKEYAPCGYEVWSDQGFTPVKHVIRHKTHKKMYRVFTETGMVDCTEDHSLLRPDGERISPNEITIGQNLLHVDLPHPVDEFRDSLHKCYSVFRDCTKSMHLCKGKLETARLYHYMNSLDLNVSVTEDSTDNDSFWIICKGKENDLVEKRGSPITKIIPLPETEQYVYDVETESHHFHVGPGRLIVHNTDSCFANFPRSSLKEAISLSHKAAELLTDVVFNRSPIEMEYEKTYCPLYIQKKKNYIGMKYEMDDVRWKIDYKGIAIKRRNYCDYVKEVFWNVIYPSLGIERKILPEGTMNMSKANWDSETRSRKALEALDTSLMKLVENKVPVEDFVISASLKSNYKGPTCTQCNGKGKTIPKCNGKHPKEKDCSVCRCKTCGGRGMIINLPHIQLAKRMKERDEGSAPISGQRFGYIIVNDAKRSSELSARSEDPKYAKQMGLLPDYIFYLEQQVKKPLTKFLSLLGKEKETEEIFSRISDSIFDQLKQERRKMQVEAKKDFINSNGKRITQVTPLKSPKKQKLTKAAKEAQATKNVPKISTFFTIK